MDDRKAVEVIAKSFLNTVFEAIAHGDEEHRAWLKEALIKCAPGLVDLIMFEKVLSASDTVREVLDK